MNQSLRILTAALVTFVVGSYLVYDTIQQNSPAYQSHPAVAVITAFWGASLSGLIYYFGSGWLMRRKKKKGNPGDSKFYDQVASELQNKTLIPGLWTRAFAEANGDDAKARALYIRFRVQQLHDEAQTRVEPGKFERREAERVVRPKLSGPVKFANFLLGAFCGLLTIVIILGMIGVLLDQSDTDETVGSKLGVILVLCLPTFFFGWITYKCVKVSQRQ